MEEQKEDITHLTYEEYYKPFLEEVEIPQNVKLK
jgi:hypothetical protein